MWVLPDLHSPRVPELGSICMQVWVVYIQFKIILFRLTDAPSTFQRFIHDAHRGLSSFADIYLDDILVFIKVIYKHLEHGHTVLQCLRNKKLLAKCTKCNFLRNSLLFFGHIVLGKGGDTQPIEGQGYC